MVYWHFRAYRTFQSSIVSDFFQNHQKRGKNPVDNSSEKVRGSHLHIANLRVRAYAISIYHKLLCKLKRGIIP